NVSTLVTSAEVAAPVAADGPASLAWLLVALPLVGAAILLLAGKALDAWGHWLGVLTSAASFVIAAWIAVDMFGRDAADRVMDLHLYELLPAGTLDVSLGMRVDPLSMTFVLLVTLV